MDVIPDPDPDEKRKRSVSHKAVGEALAALGVIGSMIFVGWEIRQSNVQATAAAYQAIGIATSQWHAALDDRQNRLFTEANHSDALQRWSLADWERYQRDQLSGLRMVETLQLQVEQGLLDADALEHLGYAVNEAHPALATPGFKCIWPQLRNRIGASLRGLIEGAFDTERFDCPVDLQRLERKTVMADTTH